MPDSWLVLYNDNPATESAAWKDFYIQQWGVPEENTLALSCPDQERITLAEFNQTIFGPVRAHLQDNPQLESKIMGILVGYGLPGCFYMDATHPPLNGGGGWSVSNNLQDLAYSTWFKRANPYTFSGYWDPDEIRLTKALLESDTYLSARIDAPSLAQAKMLTSRALEITQCESPLPESQRIYYDFEDPGAPAGDTWSRLQFAVESDAMNTPSWRYPWQCFESESEPTPECALRFSYYRLTNWDNVDWGGEPGGSRILGLAMNSWGATTVRSTTDHAGRYVPNALFNGQFAVAAGATAEPYTGSAPAPDTIVWCLAEGRTVAEAFFHANPFRNFMWEMVGDPLLRVPTWFVEDANATPDLPSSLMPPAYTEGLPVLDHAPWFEFIQHDADSCDKLSYQLQVDRNADFSNPVIDYTSMPLYQGLATFQVGQAEAGGAYTAGDAGQTLQLGQYYWRIRSCDSKACGDWLVANNGDYAFDIVEPLELVYAASRKHHGDAGPFDIPISIEPNAPMAIEPRRYGPTQLVLRFSRAVTAVDGQLDSNELLLSAGNVTGVFGEGTDTITIELESVPNQTVLSLSLQGICDLGGNSLAGQTQLVLLSLMADVNGDQLVNSADLAEVRYYSREPVTIQSFRFDIDSDGQINVNDFSLARSG
jgi:uncharacterized protein (TIGR03790 family)